MPQVTAQIDGTDNTYIAWFGYYPAGQYRVTYLHGAYNWHNGDAGYWGNAAAVTDGTGNELSYDPAPIYGDGAINASQASAEAYFSDPSRSSVIYQHRGGRIGVRCLDGFTGDNTHGDPDPVFALSELPPFDIEPRFFARDTGLRIQFNPDHALSCEWELLEAGGTGQAVVKIAVPFEQCPVQGGDIVEVWALNGETVPRCRAIVAIPDPMLDLKETQSITAYGRMEDMNHVVIDRVDCFPGGADLSWFAGHIADDYAARRPGFDFVRDIQTTNVVLETFNCAATTARAAMDQLQKQAGRNAVWGWDIDPQTGKDRFYLRPRVSTVGHQWFVGNTVKVISGATDFSVVTNAIKIQGGDAKFPQLLTNPSFEVPQIPNAATGDMLVNGGFELTTSGGSTSAGGNTSAGNWNFLNGASRNAYDPGTNHNSSAHTGRWYVLLDHVGEEVWQEIPIADTAIPYTVSLYAALESGASLSQGQLIVEGRDASGNLVSGQTFTLDLAPPSTAWTGGQGSTILAGNAISRQIVFTDATVTKARVRITATANVSDQHGLLIDDVVFAAPGEVGQLGWDSHVQHPGTSANVFKSLDWACQGAAWEGLYGVRAQVIADESDIPVLCPFPGDDSGANGYHFKTGAQQSIRVGFRVRMTQGGVNTGDGECRVEYREWAGDGHETQHVYGTFTAVPNDGNWHWVYEDITTHGDAASGTMQVAFSKSGSYDVDGCTARDVGAGESGTDPTAANYLRSQKFERYVRAEDVCAPGSDAAGSAGVYGRRESIVSNKDIVDWNADAIAWAKAYFDRNAVPINRNRVELIHEPAQIASPGEGTQIQVSGLKQSDIVEWPSRIQYTWAKSRLALQLELSNERPTMAKLLKQIDNSSTGGGSASAIAAVSGGTGTPAVAPDATATSKGIVQLAGDLAGMAAAPIVAGIQGQPVSTIPPADGQALVWNGTEYAPQSTAGGGVNQVATLPVADSGNYGSLYLKHVAGVKDTLWISMMDAAGINLMANIPLGSYALTFDPLTDVPGCQLWIAADFLSLSNGDPVTSWADRSTNGLVFTNGSGPAPVYVANAHNGLPCVRNAGGTSVLSCLAVPSGISSATGCTIFLVYKHSGGSSVFYIPLCLGSNGYSGNNGVIPYLHTPDVAVQHSGSGTATWPGAAPSENGIHLYSYVDSVNTVEWRLDGVSHGAMGLGGLFTPGSITTLFGTTPTSPNAELDFCEGLVYAGSLSSADISKVENYLLARWGLV